MILCNLELDEQLEAFAGQAHVAAWQQDPVRQKVRENVEQLTAVRDWAEAWFATAVVFEPLVDGALVAALRRAALRHRPRNPDGGVRS